MSDTKFNTLRDDAMDSIYADPSNEAGLNLDEIRRSLESVLSSVDWSVVERDSLFLIEGCELSDFLDGFHVQVCVGTYDNGGDVVRYVQVGYLGDADQSYDSARDLFDPADAAEATVESIVECVMTAKED